MRRRLRSTLTISAQFGNLAGHCCNLGEPDAAITQGEKALRLSPRDSGIWSIYGLIGWCHMVSNRVDEGNRLPDQVTCNQTREWWWVHYGLAGALGLKGNP